MTRPMIVPDLQGGLATKKPPVALAPNQSPDLSNVLIRDGVVRKRGGIQPLFRDRMPGDAVRNVPWRATASLAADGSQGEGDFVVSPGLMVAGHRTIYEDGPALTVAMWFRPDRLIGQHGGNSQVALQVYYDAPYDIKVHPIISKGPVKKSQVLSGVTAGSLWGSHTNSGMPFCVYLFNSGTGTSPVWTLRLSAHVLVAGSWTLQTVTSSIVIEETARYHIIAAVSDARVALRVGRYRDPITPTYVEDEVTFSGSLAWNKCPIQVFDCPQELIEATATGSATQRPGLALGGSQVGGHWLASSRPEATIDDISVWFGDRTLSTMDTRSKVQFDGQGDLINHWTMSGQSLEYLTEDTGRGNHMHFVPRGPTAVPDDGGKEGGSWFFNGLTSYAQIVTFRPSWRSFGSPAKDGAFYTMVRDNMAHGLAVDFWVDSIEPEYEQTIAEIHSVMRLSITVNGTLKLYVRDGGTAAPPATLQQIGAEYQSFTSSRILVPGRRYHVAAMREDGGVAAAIYIDGEIDARAITLNPSNYAATPTDGNSYPPGTITLGMGSSERMIRGPSAADVGFTDAVNTNHTSGFVGRIESFRILCSPNAATLIKRHGPEDDEDWRFAESRTWENEYLASRARIGPSDNNDTVRNTGRGSMVQIASQQQEGEQVAHAIDSPPSFQYYELSADTQQNDYAIGVTGHDFQLDGLGARIYFVFAYYRFDANPKRDRACGAYNVAYESRYTGGGPLINNPVANDAKHTHIQYCADIFDVIGNLGPVYVICSESDQITEDPAQMVPPSRAHTLRQRPYLVRSPFEFGIQWTGALADSVVGTTPVTLVADYDVQEEGRRLAIAACGKSIYWAKPAWDDGNLLFAGGIGSYVLARTDPANEPNLDVSPGSEQPVQVSLWVKPLRLDGIRMLVSKRTLGGGLEGFPSWMIYTDNGAITLVGIAGTGDPFRIVQGQINSAGDNWHGDNVLKVGVWNHVCMQMQETAVQVWINGNLVDMLDTNTLSGGLQTEAYIGGGAQPIGEVYIGGFPEDYQTSKLGVSQTFLEPWESWYGHIADVQIRMSSDTVRFNGKRGFPAPIYTADPSSIYNWPLNEGEGWLLSNVVTATAAFGAESRIREFYRIGDGLQQEDGRHYNSVNFRDSIIVTNGAEYPHQATFRGFLSRQPWRFHRLGMEAPVAANVNITALLGSTGPQVPAGTYSVYCSFINDLGLESDATFLGSYTLGAGVVTMTLAIRNLPRSHDSQVVARRIYASPSGGTDAIFNRNILDNDSWDVDVEIGQTIGVAVEIGNHSPAPRARHCAVAGSSLCLADLPDSPAGQNAFAFSTTNEVSYFPLSTIVIIDGEDGKPIVGIGHNLGDVFFSKRDSIYRLSVGAIVTVIQVDASVRLMHASDGIGGGMTDGDNMLFGCGDRGVFIFNNTDPSYLSDEIERTWREVDRTNDGLYGMFGVFWRSYSQYWVSVRLGGSDRNNGILCFDVASKAWSLLNVNPHSWMGVIEAVTGYPLVTVGSLDGRVHAYRDERYADLSDDEANAMGAVTQLGSSGLSGSATMLTMSGANFQTVLAGLAGAVVTITYNNGSADVVAERSIESNTATSIQWLEPLPGWVSFTSFVIGAISAYWTAPWLKMSPIAQDQKMSKLHLEFEPNSGSLTVDLASVSIDEAPNRQWPATVDETFSTPMVTGDTQRNLLTRAHAVGSYHRFRAGTYGINDPFALIKYAIEAKEVLAGHRTGRRS